MSKDNGGDAFPSPGVVIDYDKNEHQQGAYGGMSLRDYFAAKVIHVAAEAHHEGRCESDHELGHHEAIAAYAYAMADAMLAERAK